jgi:hypothetical protein
LLIFKTLILVRSLAVDVEGGKISDRIGFCGGGHAFEKIKRMIRSTVFKREVDRGDLIDHELNSFANRLLEPGSLDSNRIGSGTEQRNFIVAPLSVATSQAMPYVNIDAGTLMLPYIRFRTDTSTRTARCADLVPRLCLQIPCK